MEQWTVHLGMCLSAILFKRSYCFSFTLKQWDGFTIILLDGCMGSIYTHLYTHQIGLTVSTKGIHPQIYHLMGVNSVKHQWFLHWRVTWFSDSETRLKKWSILWFFHSGWAMVRLLKCTQFVQRSFWVCLENNGKAIAFDGLSWFISFLMNSQWYRDDTCIDTLNMLHMLFHRRKNQKARIAVEVCFILSTRDSSNTSRYGGTKFHSNQIKQMNRSSSLFYRPPYFLC